MSKTAPPVLSEEDFEAQFLALRNQLHSFLLRVTANRQDADDLAQDTYLKAARRLDSFAGRSSLKTWIFAIAYNLARDHQRSKNRWRDDIQDRCRTATQSSPEKVAKMRSIVDNSPAEAYEFREHIDYCFTCLGKTLTIEQQVTLILKHIYRFKISEICRIVGSSEGKVKHILAEARRIMIGIFDRRCTLVSQKGVCHQCSEMSGFFNPKQDARKRMIQLQLHQEAQNGASKDRLFELRAALIENVDPLLAPGADLHAYLLELMLDHAD